VVAEPPDLRFEWKQNQKLRKDLRVTRVGRFLRRTSLDEPPQPWNVPRGEMSLIGPRPIVDEEVPRYDEAHESYGRVKPRMSGLWQVSGRSATSYAQRVKLDPYSVRNWSVWLDLVLLARTVRTVLLDLGSY
jgi:lipopolysaccharide/colanic/teichoic acid biosynthesis glycosyltransferase